MAAGKRPRYDKFQRGRHFCRAQLQGGQLNSALSFGSNSRDASRALFFLLFTGVESRGFANEAYALRFVEKKLCGFFQETSAVEFYDVNNEYLNPSGS